MSDEILGALKKRRDKLDFDLEQEDGSYNPFDDSKCMCPMEPVLCSHVTDCFTTALLAHGFEGILDDVGSCPEAKFQEHLQARPRLKHHPSEHHRV